MRWTLLLLVGCTGAAPDDTDDTDDPAPELADVCADGVAPFADLQAAIDAAASGDEITVCAGTWGPIAWAGKVLRLRAIDGPATTTLRGDLDHPAVDVRNTGAGTAIVGFALSGDGGADVIGLYAEEATITLEDARFSGVLGSNGNGSAIWAEAGALTLENVQFFDNYDVPHLVHLQRGNHVIRHLDVHDNHDCYSAVAVFDKVGLTLSNSLFYRNDDGGTGVGLALEAFPVDPVTVWNNVWYDNHYQTDAYVPQGIDFDNNISMGSRGQEGIKNLAEGADYNIGYSSTGYPIDTRVGLSNQNVDPKFVDAPGGDFHLAPGSPAIDAGNPDGGDDVDGTRADIGAYGGPAGDW